MPITCPVEFRILTAEEFRQLDYEVMAHVFASHNTLGRLHDEEIYQRDIAARLQAAGLDPVRTEVPLVVTWRAFHKKYFLDLVVRDTLLGELKTATALAGEHKTQTLNYVLLLGLRSAKLLNLRPPQVESWIASTTLTPEDRRRVRGDTVHWQGITPICADFQSALMDLVGELGAYLDVALYEDLLTQFLGGVARVVQRVEIVRDGMPLGKERCHLLAPDVGFQITAHTEQLDHARAHLHRWLRHTNLRALQWVNLNRAEIQFITLTK